MSQLEFLKALREEEEEEEEVDGQQKDVSPLTDEEGDQSGDKTEDSTADKGWGQMLAESKETAASKTVDGGWGAILGGPKRKADEGWSESAAKAAKVGEDGIENTPFAIGMSVRSETPSSEFPEAAHIKILFYASEGVEVSAEDVHNYKTSLKTDKGSATAASAQQEAANGPPRAFELSDEQHGGNEAVGVASIPKEEFKDVLDKLVWSMDTDTEPLWRRAHPNELSAYFNYGLNEQLFREYMMDKQICLRLDRAKRNKITVGTYPAQGNISNAPGAGGRGGAGGGGQRHMNPRDMEDMPGADDPKRSLYVCGFPAEWGEQELHDLFIKYGQLESVVIMPNRVGHSRGAGFVNYDDNVLSQQVVMAMNGYCVPDRPDCILAVRFAKAKTQQLPPGAREKDSHRGASSWGKGKGKGGDGHFGKGGGKGKGKGWENRGRTGGGGGYHY
ncbi:poly(A) binding protein, cytoplasmic 1-like [Perkinsus chesapeaki]|uniref:Poly(A) binding protein, cytoplasmic 1-like n=1 Tax=Perkinsus chesapeaki TaxID=330153 RepID=A0A7J6MU19_PERCH|nr:poly(A) binding protein, cytoplasmic 1-like [Perkinsus chesapeaki]